jgi:hypothetical protein
VISYRTTASQHHAARAQAFQTWAKVADASMAV